MIDTPDAAPAPQNIHQAIHAVKSALALHGIAKGRENTDQRYKFRGVEDVLNALSELFVQHRINVIPRIVQVRSVERQTGNGKPMPASFVDAEFDLVSVDDGSIVTFKAPGEGADLSDKGTNKAMSAAFKYAMTLGFVIPTQGVLEEGDATTPGSEPERDERRDNRGSNDRGNDRGGGQQRQQRGGNSRDTAAEMQKWVTGQITTFESYKEPAQFDALSNHADDPQYKSLKDKVAKADKKLWDKLAAAEREAFQRTDDVPF